MDHGENASAAVVDVALEAALERRVLEEELGQLHGMVAQPPVSAAKLAELVHTRQEALDQIDHPPAEDSDDVPFEEQ